MQKWTRIESIWGYTHPRVVAWSLFETRGDNKIYDNQLKNDDAEKRATEREREREREHCEIRPIELRWYSHFTLPWTENKSGAYERIFSLNREIIFRFWPLELIIYRPIETLRVRVKSHVSIINPLSLSINWDIESKSVWNVSINPLNVNRS